MGPAQSGRRRGRWREWWNDPEALSYYFMGKDNITFHSQIWPAELLAYSGKGDRDGKPGEYGELNLPTEVVSSEFLTMEGKKFSSSQRVVIYVRDLLSRYQPDAFRYFVAAAGPENQDSDFTWSEFVRRTNDELVAGWGNLVNRTANMIAKSFGEIPAAGELTAEDQALLDHVEAAFGVVGDLIGRHRQKAAIGEAMRAVAEVNKYVSDSEPWKLKGDDERERLGTILHVVAQCVADLNTILSPFLPFSANAVDAVLGGSGEVQPMPRLEEVDDLDGGAGYPVITGDYSDAPPAGSGRRSRSGTPIGKPTPVFTKLDPAVVDEELARLASRDPAGQDEGMAAEMYLPRFFVRQKLTMMVNRYEISEANPDGSPGRLMAVAQQKRMALKEQVTFYARRGRTQPVFSFQARQVMDLNAGYDVRDAAGPRSAASARTSARACCARPSPSARRASRRPARSATRRWRILRRFVDLPFAFHFDFTDQASGRS